MIDHYSEAMRHMGNTERTIAIAALKRALQCLPVAPIDLHPLAGTNPVEQVRRALQALSEA
jgi:hypothetical protein